jgi:acyl-CoA synthetase (AMP-forming)/AMP-acid ligase II
LIERSEPESIITLSSLADVARAPARLHPGAPACRFDGRTTDYATFDRRADQIAGGLIDAGVRPSDRIAVIARNSDRYLEVLVGVIRARATLVAVNWRLAAPEIDYIIDHAGARLVFSETGLGSGTASDRPGWVLDDEGGGPRDFTRWRDAQRAQPVGGPVDLDEDIVQMYTSGTTGRPKGVCLTHRNYLSLFDQVSQFPWGRLDGTDRVFAPSPFFHVSGLNLALRALAQGACLVTTASFTPEDLPQTIQRERITRTVMVPAVIQICLSAPNAAEIDYSSLKSVTYGGSPVTQDVLSRAQQTFGCEFVQGYGLTETCGVATFLHPEDHAPGRGKLESCGRSVPGAQIKVVDAEGSDCAPGVIGEVLVRGPNLMREYWRNPAATAAAVVDGWLHTGDAGYLDDEGYLYIRDRLKDMIVSGGENVYPAEVENVLADHPAVADVAVIGVPDERWGEAVKALVVVQAGVGAEAAEILGSLRGRIAAYKIPKTLDFVEALPRNPSGKILRRELREPFWAGHARQVN